VLEECGRINAESIEEYLAIGGYSAFEKTLFDMSPEELITEITESNIRGRVSISMPRGSYIAAVFTGVVSSAL
jgi:NADH-quinone oxidoreductase subunit F